MNGYAQAESGTLSHSLTSQGGMNAARSTNRILRRNEHLIHAGDQVRHAHVVVSGVLKSYINYENGDSQVLGFHIPGDIIGHESLINGRSFCGVLALDTSSVRRLETVGETTSQALIESMHSEIQRLTRQLHLERECSTAARLATFLMDYSESQAQRGYCRYEFILPMGRRDLAGYLGLATETLSRVFSRFRDQGILRVSTNHVTILDPARLEAASGTATEESRLIC
ncbi:Crp/Fnr family transcriptional regulator [Halospina denitrificans]|uniref:Crp/Fnr family transcriptional regulator n=1 Tax=Halospina denitrificans TaxID=332522 RepID=A0A4V3EQJ2_9GAMM|nr:helix-turn-helix domain-containing protein [Halospina denitrificans]TDT41438.1 Crp/Fnr family transcriptional regulator [Halospina denitrificans]